MLSHLNLSSTSTSPAASGQRMNSFFLIITNLHNTWPIHASVRPSPALSPHNPTERTGRSLRLSHVPISMMAPVSYINIIPRFPSPSSPHLTREATEQLTSAQAQPPGQPTTSDAVISDNNTYHIPHTDAGMMRNKTRAGSRSGGGFDNGVGGRESRRGGRFCGRFES